MSDNNADIPTGTIPPGTTLSLVPPTGSVKNNYLNQSNVGKLFTLGDNKYIFIGYQNSANRFISLDITPTEITDKNINDFKMSDPSNPQTDALTIATSSLFGYTAFNGTDKISENPAVKASGVKSYYIIDENGNTKKVSWTGFWGKEKFDTNKKYICKPNNPAPIADYIKEGKISDIQYLLKYITSNKGGKKNKTKKNKKKSK